MFILLLLPNVFIVGISYSLDYPVILSLLFIFTTILNIREKKCVSNTDIIILSVAGVFTVFAKIPYILFTPIILMIYKYVDKKEFKRTVAIYSVVILLTTVITSIYVMNQETPNFIGITEFTNPSEQMKYVLTNPLKFISATINPIFTTIKYYIPNTLNIHFVGSEGSVGYGSLSFKMFGIIVPVLFFSAFYEVQDIKITVKERLFIIFICALATYGVLGSLYLTYSPLRGGDVLGYQTRYYTPLLIMSLVAILPINKSVVIKDKLTLLEVGQKVTLAITMFIALLFLQRIVGVGNYAKAIIIVIVIAVVTLKYLKGLRDSKGGFILVLLIVCYVVLGTLLYFLQYNL